MVKSIFWLNGNRSVEDILCPKCGSDDCYPYNTDELEFCADQTGHYIADYHCPHCQCTFRMYFELNYSVTSARREALPDIDY